MRLQRLRSAPRRHSRILGVGAYQPKRVVTNTEICQHIDSSDEWIVARSGIRLRRFAGDDEDLLAMAADAGQKALAAAGVEPGSLGCVILASMSNLVQTPPLAVGVAHDIGARRAAAFDLSAACAGFCHALAVASDMVCAGNADYVLVIGAERMTDIVDPKDRTIAFLFADGAGAAVIGPAETVGIGPVVRGAAGAYHDALRMNTSWRDFRADASLPAPAMKMDGRRVFRWAVRDVVPAAQRALDAAGVRADELAAFIPHQANERMIDLMAERIGIPEHVAVARDVAISGNTSAASIPLAIWRMLQENESVSGGTALLIGFGAGLNYAGQVVILP